MNESVVYDHAMLHDFHTSYNIEPACIKSLALYAPPFLGFEHMHVLHYGRIKECVQK
jgi:hypothetical protein